MYGCESWTIKKAEHRRIYAFERWCCRRLLRVPWTARRSNLSILKEISPEYSVEGLMLKLKLQHFGHMMRRTASLEKTLMLGRIEGRKTRGWQRMRDGWMASLTWWTWVWASPGSWWWTGKPGCATDHGVAKSQTWLSDWTELRGGAGDRREPSKSWKQVHKFGRKWHQGSRERAEFPEEGGGMPDTTQEEEDWEEVFVFGDLCVVVK